MSSLCQSTKYLQEEYYHEIKVKTHRRVRSQQLPNPQLPFYQPDEHQHIGIYQYQSEMTHRDAKTYGKNRGLQLTRNRSEREQKKGGMKLQVRKMGERLSLFQEMGPLNSTRTVSNLITNNHNDIVPNPRIKHTPNLHKPHPILARQSPIPPTPRCFKAQQKPPSSRTKPTNKPNLALIGIPSCKKQQSTRVNSQDLSVGWTVKKEQQEDARHSQETASNKNSSNLENKSGGQNMKRAHIFDELGIDVHQLDKKKPQISTPTSPTRAKKLLEDAKSIVSLDEQTSKIEDFLFDESILVDHDLDIFTELVPLKVQHHTLMKAIDQRNGKAVTLKYFSQAQEKEYHGQLDLIQLVEGLGNEQYPVKVLKFQYSFISEQKGEKQVVFVYQAIQSTLIQRFTSSNSKNKSHLPFIDTLIRQLTTLLQILALNGIVLIRPLTLDDFCMVTDDWRLHSLQKFRLDIGKINHIPERFVAGLRNELQKFVI